MSLPATACSIRTGCPGSRGVLLRGWGGFPVAVVADALVGRGGANVRRKVRAAVSYHPGPTNASATTRHGWSHPIPPQRRPESRTTRTNGARGSPQWHWL